ncbi:MAG: efflux transporter outer membrane subunit [Desulfovibrio sp.]|uniref:efflux transporter outer membrane subunit n=1 Tax=Desulfovibrio sp. 7SRBS1 TaxID=3378064 RepID=UPI003B409CF0
MKATNHMPRTKNTSAHHSGRSALLGSGLVGSGLLMLVLLAGCAVGPDYHQPALDLPGQWNATQAIDGERLANLKKWWNSLEDPLLDRLINEAVQGSLNVAAAQARVRQARATYREAGGKLLPLVDGSASAARTGYGKTSASSTNGRSNYYNKFKAGFDASWELDFFGANRRNLEAAGFGLDAAQEDLNSALLTLIGDVALNYVEARGYQARIALAKSTAESQKETAHLTTLMVEAGVSSAVDMHMADALVNTTEANIPTYEAMYAQAVHRLGILLGKAPDSLLGLMKDSTPVPMPRRELPAGVPANILLNRPDVRMAERQLAQTTARIGQAEAARYPAISISGSLDTSSATFGDIAKGSSIGWVIGPSLSIPIFNGGQLAAKVEIAEAKRDQQYYAYRIAVLSALEDVENNTVALSREQTRIKDLAKAVRNYKTAVELSQLLYQNGASNFLDVLAAERSLYSAQDQFVQSKVAIVENYISLAKALGGGWDKALDAGQPLDFDADGNLLATATATDQTTTPKRDTSRQGDIQ